MKVLVILLVLVGIVGSLVISQNAYALSLGMSSDRIMETQEIILLGNVDSVKYNTDHTEYTISVLEYVKTPDNLDKTNSMQAIGCGENQTGGCITFESGQRVLFVLNERDRILTMSDLSFVAPNPDCSVDDYFKLNDAKSGLHILQNNQTEHFFTGEPINLTFYAYNKNLDDSNYNVTIDYYRANNNVVFSKTFEGQFEECIPNVKLETSFTPSEMGKYGNRYTTSYGDNQSVWGFPIIERDSSPLQQFKHGVNTNHILYHNDLLLVQKYDGSPACVTESTKTKLIERGWTGKDDSISKTSANCMTLEQSKETASFFKIPTYLPEGYEHVCSQSGTPFESYIVYYHQEIPYWNIPELVSDGAIFIYQIDERNMIGDKEFQTYGSPAQRIQETYDEVMKKNPSLNPQLITIDGILAYAVDSCNDCGIQTANFTDGTVIQKSTSTETRIKFYDENGVGYLLETTLPLSELIKVAESLQ